MGLINNGALVLKSRNSLHETVDSFDYASYKQRVLMQGGFIVDEEATKQAIKFASSNGINSYTDVGCVSPRWGILIGSDGLIAKMFSLFNPDADIVPALRPASSERNSTLGIDTLLLKGSLTMSLVTNGFSVKESVVSLNLVKPVQRAGTEYGSGYGFTISHGYISDPLSYVRNLQSIWYNRATLESPPSTWNVKTDVQGFNAERIEVDIPNDATKFNTLATYVDSNRFKAFTNGSTALDEALKNTADFSDKKVAFEYNNRYTYNGTQTYPALADIAEIWTVRDVSSDVAHALSQRASTVYANY